LPFTVTEDNGWKQFCLPYPGLLPPGTQFDLFRGTAAMKQDIDDMYPTTLSHTIKVVALIQIYYLDLLE
jgi:hypothetical protein